MKRVLIISTMSLTVLSLAVLLTGCPTVPTVTTKDATNITSNSATLHGTISGIPEDNSATVYFRWEQYQGQNEFSDDPSYTPEITKTSNTAFSSVLTGLMPNTTYIFQVECESSTHYVSWGEILNFTTSPAPSGEQDEEEDEGDDEEEDEEDGYEYDIGYVEYYLTISSSEGGTVTWPGEGTFHYAEDEVGYLEAEADEGYQFDRWEGGVEDTYSPSTTIRIYDDDWVMAYFIPIPLFELRSDDFNPEQAIPLIHSRWGGNVSPQLHWTDAPSDAVSFVLIMKDPVGWTGPCVHWIVFNIPADVTSLAEGASSNLPEGALQGTGDDAFGYYGCEPLSGQLHEYNFTIYALDNMLNLSQGVSEQQVLNAMEGHIIDQAVLVGTYQG
jgi:Raf kinase inhibitor-like YbhB/YbcL family protein